MFISLDKVCLFDNQGTAPREIAHLDVVKIWLKTNMLPQNKKAFYLERLDVDKIKENQPDAMNESSLHLIRF